MTRAIQHLEEVVRRRLQGARHDMTAQQAPPKEPPKSQRARTRVRELEQSGLTEDKAVETAARELGLARADVRKHLKRGDRTPGPGRRANAAKGKAAGAIRTAEVSAWLRALSSLPGLDSEAAYVLEEASKGVARGDVEACREPFSGKKLGGLTHIPIFKKKHLPGD